MTLNDAKTVLNIMAKADRGCKTCVRELFTRFSLCWPEHGLSVQHVWSETFGGAFEPTDYLPGEDDEP